MPITDPWFHPAAVPAVLVSGISKGGFGGGLGIVAVLLALTQAVVFVADYVVGKVPALAHRTGSAQARPWACRIGEVRMHRRLTGESGKPSFLGDSKPSGKEVVMRYLWPAFAALVTLGAAAGDQRLEAAETANYAYIGTYTRNAPGGDSGKAQSEGIYVAKVAPETGELSLIQTVPSDNPSFLALSPDQRFLYAINEIKDFEGAEVGSVEAYRIDDASGEIALINRQALPGPIPAHLAVDPSGLHLVVGLYIGSSYVVLPIGEDGSLGAPSHEVMQEGSGPNEARQTAPHPHAVVFDPAGRYIATADLGIDKVEIFDLQDGKLAKISTIAAVPGAGPRHVAFNPDGTMLYVINELNATIDALPYDADSGKLGEAIATVSTVPDDFPDHKSTAEILVHPSGKFLYGSNRRFADHPAADSVAVFRLDAQGVPERVQLVTENVAFPRAIQLDPTGTWLYALNQKGDNIVQLAIDQETGELTPTGHIADVPTPVSLVFTTGE